MPVPINPVTIEKAIKQLNLKNDLEALILFNKAISENGKIFGINYGKAVALARLGRFQEAIDLLKKILDCIPNHKKAHKLLNELRTSSHVDLMAKRNFSGISFKLQEL